MSAPPAFGANPGQAFVGGSYNPGTVPGLAGTIAAAGQGSGLISSVAAQQAKISRNDRGTNVTVPYARLVLHPSGQTALPPIPDEGVELAGLTNDRVTTLSRGVPNDNMLIEVEALRAGRIAFILGRRGIRYNSEISRVTGIDQLGQNTVPFRAASKFAGLAVGQSDLVSFQRLCSFEYLQRYFYHVLRHQTIQIGDGAPLNAGDAVLNAEQASKFAKQLPPAVRWPKARVVLQAPDQTVTNINAKELAKALGVDKPEPPAEMADSGVFIADEGPFLRGKSIEVQVLRSQRRIHDAAVGDEVAFHVLAQRLAEAGLLDWTPDGLVHSKLTQGDALLDEQLDSRDGELYNITIGGPNTATAWLDSHRMRVLPLDKVFVLLVADVWDGKTEEDIKGLWESDDLEAYPKEKTNQLDGNLPDLAARLATLKAKDTKATLTNFRLRLSTSSEMVATSALKPGKDNRKDADMSSRMGLKIGVGVSEYVVGGWCIGTVLDSAAARGNRAGATLMGTVMSEKTSVASTVSVKIEFWSADKLYRKYMNVGGGIKHRYHGRSSEKRAFGKANEVVLPASKRAATGDKGGDKGDKGKKPPAGA